MDLSDFQITVEPLEEKVTHVDPATGENVEANEMRITWQHNTLSVSTLNFYLRENHPDWNDKLNMRERQILNTWMEELGYDKNYFHIKDKTIEETGKVKQQEQVDNWLQPNNTNVVAATEVEEI